MLASGGDSREILWTSAHGARMMPGNKPFPQTLNASSCSKDLDVINVDKIYISKAMMNRKKKEELFGGWNYGRR